MLFDNTITRNTCQSSFMLHVCDFNASDFQFASTELLYVPLPPPHPRALHTDQMQLVSGIGGFFGNILGKSGSSQGSLSPHRPPPQSPHGPNLVNFSDYLGGMGGGNI